MGEKDHAFDPARAARELNQSHGSMRQGHRKERRRNLSSVRVFFLFLPTVSPLFLSLSVSFCSSSNSPATFIWQFYAVVILQFKSKKSETIYRFNILSHQPDSMQRQISDCKYHIACVTHRSSIFVCVCVLSLPDFDCLCLVSFSSFTLFPCFQFPILSHSLLCSHISRCSLIRLFPLISIRTRHTASLLQ